MDLKTNIIQWEYGIDNFNIIINDFRVDFLGYTS